MAYAAVISLKHTIEQLMNSSDILLDPPSSQIIESAYKEVNSLNKHLKKLDSRIGKRSVNASLEEGMREKVFQIEDIIESHHSNLLLISQSQLGGTRHPLSFSVDLRGLKPDIQDICSFTSELKKMKQAYLRESRNIHLDDDDDDDDDISSSLIDSGGNKSKIVGFSDVFSNIKEELISYKDKGETLICSIVGMAGIGKTTLAKRIFKDLDIVECFEYRVWVKLGRKNYQFIEIARRILTKLNPESADKLFSQEDEEICLDLRRSLENKRCLIVLDDVWDHQIMGRLYIICRSQLLFTTRLTEVAARSYMRMYKISLLNKEESWDVFCVKVFGEELCPREFMKPGKKIAKKCEGLPLLIVTVAKLLSMTDNNLEYWNKIAEDKRSQLFNDAYKEIREVLFPSYDHLPQYLKTCFLYMGVFPQDYEIPKSIIINLWIAEGVLELNGHEMSEVRAMKCLYELVSNNVIIVHQTRSLRFWVDLEEVKTCGLHSSFWHMCNGEAEKDKFLHVINNLEDSSDKDINGHRRLCIHNNVLFGIKDVYNSIERVCASVARSLLCFGPYHQYEVPMCFGLRLLKVLDALAIRFYDFPLEVVNLVLLRYLAFTCNGKLPPSITKLRRLQFLIVGRHLTIKSCRDPSFLPMEICCCVDPSYLPMEIWDMKELKHLQIMGSDLPNPRGNHLPKLLTLIGVSAHSCTKEVLEGIPNLEKLGILIELEPNATEPLHCFGHISNLNKLRSFKCVVVNPIFSTPPAPLSMMPSCLRKLHLSGLGYPWEYMTTIASLPYLEGLKLQCYAFQGPKWEILENHFPRLMSLLIEDTDLVQLKAASGSFLRLYHISMKHCYDIEKLHLDIFTPLVQIEFVDCNPVAVNYVQQTIKDGSARNPHDGLVVHCSWIDGNLKSSQPTNWSKRKFLKAQ